MISSAEWFLMGGALVQLVHILLGVKHKHYWVPISVKQSRAYRFLAGFFEFEKTNCCIVTYTCCCGDVKVKRIWEADFKIGDIQP